MEIQEFMAGHKELIASLNRSLDKDFDTSSVEWLYIQDVFIDHPVLGNSAIVGHNGGYYAVPYIETADGRIRLDVTASWKDVRVQYSFIDDPVVDNMTEVISESSNDITIFEDEDKSPLILKTRIIKEGFGNSNHNHYYSKQLLMKSASKFVNAKMYLTNHRQQEVNARNEVAVVMEAAWDEEQNGIVAKVGVFDEAFAQNIRNRSELGVLESLHCSINATGMVDPEPVTYGDRTGKAIKEFTTVKSVDWVSNAGAGGNALEIL